MNEIPEITLNEREVDAFLELRERLGTLEDVESDLLVSGVIPGLQSEVFQSIRHKLAELWRVRDYAVLRKLPACPHGVTGLIAASLCFSNLKSYRGGKVVKHFRMSPWTKALSHTLASGFFHTDLNTADIPPAMTAMQCLDPDPGAPVYGQLRVARLNDLIARLHSSHPETAAFLLNSSVIMVNETCPTGWEGAMVKDGLIRYHPESLVAAQKYFGKNIFKLDIHLSVIHQTALAISVPISLDAGEMLLVSNRRALHQRGTCTVKFKEFPSNFESRRVSVFHAYDEPA